MTTADVEALARDVIVHFGLPFTVLASQASARTTESPRRRRADTA